MSYPELKGYKIEKELGKNAAGARVTYLAIDTVNKRPIVIKEFQFARSDSSWSQYTAMTNEITALKQLDHPQIPKYIAAIESDTGFYLVQEYVNGRPLTTEVKKCDNHIELVFDLSLQILDILIYLQSLNPPIFHRDIKPENILVDDNYRAYLVDFGFAKSSDRLGASSVVKGTLGFMPPEQIFNRKLSLASDLYGLGVTIFCWLSCTDSGAVSELFDENFQISYSRLPANLDGDYRRWLKQMTARSPTKRFANAQIAKENLKNISLKKLRQARSALARIDSLDRFILEVKSDGEPLESRVSVSSLLLTAAVSTAIVIFGGFSLSNLFVLHDDTIKPPQKIQLAASEYYDRANREYAAKNYARAIELYSLAIADRARAPIDSYLQRGIAYFELKNYQQASADLTEFLNSRSSRSIASNKKARAYYYRAKARFHLKNYRAALADSNRFVNLKERNPDGFSLRGTVRFYLKDYEKSLADYELVLKLEPDRPNAYNNRGSAYLVLEKFSLARLDFDRAIANFPENPQPYYNRGLIEYKSGNLQLALQDWQKAATLFKQNGDTANYDLVTAEIDRAIAENDTQTKLEKSDPSSVTIEALHLLQQHLFLHNSK